MTDLERVELAARRTGERMGSYNFLFLALAEELMKMSLETKEQRDHNRVS